MIDEKGLEAAALEFKRHHRNCCYPEALGGEATRAVQAIITAYLSARSAEPVASEIGEEEIARIVRQAMRSNPEEGPFRHRESERSLIASETARQTLALLQPAIERARREERERCAVIAEGCGDTWSGSRCVEQAVQEAAADEKAAEIAAAIRKG